MSFGARWARAPQLLLVQQPSTFRPRACRTGFFSHRGQNYDSRVSALVRAYDPCLSRSTHALGMVPVKLSLVGPGGELLDENAPDWRRDADSTPLPGTEPGVIIGSDLDRIHVLVHALTICIIRR